MAVFFFSAVELNLGFILGGVCGRSFSRGSGRSGDQTAYLGIAVSGQV